MRQIKLIIEYDGTNYAGWQSQRKPALSTIQDVIEDRIGKIIKDKPAKRLLPAGRTDAGVHALGQVASFRTESKMSAQNLRKALNATLPPDIRIVEAGEAPDDFHPRRCLKKTYFYLIAQMFSVPVFLNKYMWRIPVSLDIPAMRRAARHISGKRDFSCFRAAGCSSKSPVKQLGLEIAELHSMDFLTTAFEGQFLRITLTADSFLRHMARNIAGTLIEVGRGRIKADEIAGIMESKDRRAAGPKAPACGLFLERIYY